MTAYQIYTRLKHSLVAKHWRGHGVHSPMMYDFIRTVVMPTPRKWLAEAIIVRYGGAGNVAVVDSMSGLENEREKANVVLLNEPFLTAEERRRFKEWYGDNNVVAVHLQGLMVLFFDTKLKKQFYSIRI